MFDVTPRRRFRLWIASATMLSLRFYSDFGSPEAAERVFEAKHQGNAFLYSQAMIEDRATGVVIDRLPRAPGAERASGPRAI